MTATAFMNCEKARRETPGAFPVQVDPIHDVANGPKAPLQVGFYRSVKLVSLAGLCAGALAVSLVSLGRRPAAPPNARADLHGGTFSQP